MFLFSELRAFPVLHSVHLQNGLACACQEVADQGVDWGARPLAGGGARSTGWTGTPREELFVCTMCVLLMIMY